MEPVENLVNTLSKVEYLTTFNAFIFGYIVNRFFTGWARFFRSWQSVSQGTEYFAWSFLGFCMLLELWWTSWLRLVYIDKTPFTFYVSILPPFILYLITTLYFPSVRKDIPLRKYYYFQRKKGYFFYCAFYLTTILGSIFVIDTRWSLPFGIAGFVLTALAFFSPKRSIEKAVLVVLYALMITQFIFIPSYASAGGWTIKGFAFSEYIVVFTTFIYAFIITRFLDGWAYFVVNRKILRINFEYILWTGVIFGLLIDFWRGMWDRNQYISKEFAYFLLSLAPAFGFYIISFLLFPVKKPERNFFIDPFTKNARAIYGVMILILSFDFLTSWITSITDILGMENLFRLIVIAICLLGILMNRRSMNRTLLIVSGALLLLHNILNFYYS